MGLYQSEGVGGCAADLRLSSSSGAAALGNPK
jgi:hypothetical protein